MMNSYNISVTMEIDSTANLLTSTWPTDVPIVSPGVCTGHWINLPESRTVTLTFILPANTENVTYSLHGFAIQNSWEPSKLHGADWISRHGLYNVPSGTYKLMGVDGNVVPAVTLPEESNNHWEWSPSIAPNGVSFEASRDPLQVLLKNGQHIQDWCYSWWIWVTQTTTSGWGPEILYYYTDPAVKNKKTQ